MTYLQAICFDFGDTLADQATEIKDETETTLEAELIPGAAEVILELHARSYPLALIADGRPGTYENVLTQHDLYDYFGAFAISELVGVEKPDRRMFDTALEQLSIGPEAYPRSIMVGNKLERDVKGANQIGMISVWLDWSPRDRKMAEDLEEIPAHTIHTPLELIPLVDAIESEFAG